MRTNRARTILATLMVGSLIGLGVNVRADPATSDSSNSVSHEHDTVNVASDHHYNSPAERANDALLSSLAPGSGLPCTRIPLFQLSPVMGA